MTEVLPSAHHIHGVGPAWLWAGALALGLPVGWLLSRWLARATYRIEEEVEQPPRGLSWVVPTTALLWASLAWRFGDPDWRGYLPVALYLATAGVALAAIDRDVHRLPEMVTVPSYPILLALLALASATTGDWGALVRALLAGAASFAVYFLLLVLASFVSPGGLGFGDVMLSGIIGMSLGWLSWDSAVVACLAAFLIAGVAALFLVVVRRASRHTHIAFGPFMLLGAWVALMLSPATLLIAA